MTGWLGPDTGTLPALSDQLWACAVSEASGPVLCLLRASLFKLPVDSSLRHSLRLASTAFSMGEASLKTAHQLRNRGMATRSKKPTCEP